MENNVRMKILIAYDGSVSAESAIDDLKRAWDHRAAESSPEPMKGGIYDLQIR